MQIWLTFAPILTTKLSTMAFDIEMIKNLYAAMPAKVEAARKLLNRPLTLSEKILFAHLHGDQKLENFERGGSYVDFGPDRVAMQDTTAAGTAPTPRLGVRCTSSALGSCISRAC